MRGRFNGRVVGQDYTGRNTRHNGRAGMYNAVQSAFAPSLDITLANGLGPLFTFTRATTATVTEGVDGLIKSCLSGELRVQGARRVQNLITTPDLSNAAWSKEQGGTGSAPTLTYGQTDPNGGTTATRAQLNRGAGNTASDYSGVYFRAIASGATTTAVGRVAIKSNTGSSQTFTIKLDATSQVQITATTSWQTFSVSRTQSGNQDFEILSWGQNAGSTNSLDLLVAFPQCENVTGQSNQNPSEYVSVGVLSSPFHGYFVDGVKYFSYQNGNTVSSNVVTEAQGAAITGTIGYLAEGARTDSALYNRDLTQADWSKTNCTAAKDAVGQDGTTNGCSTLTATGANATCLQTVTAGSASEVFQPSIKRKTGTGTIEITVNGGTNWQDVTAQLSTGTWYEAAETRTVTNPQFGFRITTSGDEIIVDYAGCQNGTFRSSSIPTTTAAVARNADQLTCPSAGILNFAQGAAFVKATGGGNASGRYIDLFSTYPLARSGAGGVNLTFNDGTNNETVGTLSSGAFSTPSKMMTAWGGGASAGCVDGGSVTTGLFDGALAGATLYIGGAATVETYAVIEQVKLYLTKPSAAQMQAMTS